LPSSSLHPEATMADPYAAVRASLNEVERQIAWACHQAGRNWREVTVVAVTKTRSLGEILAAYRCGLRHLGENRIEEAEPKMRNLRSAFGADQPRWHMVGHVQSRKAYDVARLTDVVHSIDSARLAGRMDRYAADVGKRLPILLEVNVSGEASKDGFPAWDDQTLDAFLAEAQTLGSLAHLDVRGLMTIAPVVSEPEQARAVFARLRQARDALRARATFSEWNDLSMGMTDDYPVAVQEGATLVRLGRAIFGPLASDQPVAGPVG
jgi:hypothetical protein